MKTIIKRDRIANKFISADITNIEKDEYTSIMFCIRMRLENLEEKLEEYKINEHLKEFIPSTQKETEQLKQELENEKNKPKDKPQKKNDLLRGASHSECWVIII